VITHHSADVFVYGASKALIRITISTHHMSTSASEDQILPDPETLQPETANLTDHELLLKELEEWKDLAHRRSAEIANMQRRAVQERADLEHRAAERMINKLLPVLDDLHAAVEASRTSSDATALQQGLEMIYTKTMKIFEDSGISVIEAEAGQLFNVDVHEALMLTPSDVPEGHVIQTVQRGYSLHERVLRHAKVITSAGPTQ
jgi:molecular chaperone GrpE